jgi:transcriptional regulator GlxA family with amidase domain
MDNANLSGHALAEMPKSPRSAPNQVRVVEVLAYPAVQLRDVTGPLQVFASANDQGVTAGIDLALALVEEDLGRTVALAVARYLVVFLKRPGGQAQFSTALSLQAAEDKFGALHDWIGRHLADDISLSALARQAGMSERSFSRRYAEATGLTPVHAVERLRVEAARRLLSESRLPVKRISQRCGFGSEETMRRSFLRLLATTPQDYRERFSA